MDLHLFDISTLGTARYFWRRFIANRLLTTALLGLSRSKFGHEPGCRLSVRAHSLIPSRQSMSKLFTSQPTCCSVWRAHARVSMSGFWGANDRKTSRKCICTSSVVVHVDESSHKPKCVSLAFFFQPFNASHVHATHAVLLSQYCSLPRHGYVFEITKKLTFAYRTEHSQHALFQRHCNALGSSPSALNLHHDSMHPCKHNHMQTLTST